MISPKPPKSYQEQLEILKNRGLEVTNEAVAFRSLMHLNYYRLSAYRFPLTKRGNHDQFRKGAKFEYLLWFYDFDRKMRRLVMEASKQVEISVRSRWAYTLAHKYGPQAYEIPELFHDQETHAELLKRLDDAILRSEEEFIDHYMEKYGMLHPPIWVVCEVMSLGQTSRFYTLLKSDSDREAIAKTYGLSEVVLCSFLHHLTIVRNHAAHHGRIWSRRFGVSFQIPKNKPKDLRLSFVTPDRAEPERERKLYNTLVMLLYLLSIIDPDSLWPKKLVKHISQMPTRYLDYMGFPTDWEELPIWKSHIPQSTRSEGETVDEAIPEEHITNTSDPQGGGGDSTINQSVDGTIQHMPQST